MTLTADRRVGDTMRSTRSDPVVASPVSASPILTPARPELTVVLALDDVYRVVEGGRIVGYVQVAGPVFVALSGEIYNTSVEVAQCLDLDSAVTRLDRTRA